MKKVHAEVLIDAKSDSYWNKKINLSRHSGEKNASNHFDEKKILSRFWSRSTKLNLNNNSLNSDSWSFMIGPQRQPLRLYFETDSRDNRHRVGIEIGSFVRLVYHRQHRHFGARLSKVLARKCQPCQVLHFSRKGWVSLERDSPAPVFPSEAFYHFSNNI